MNVLNKEVFNQTKKLIGLVISNKMVDSFSKQFKKYVFQRTGIKPINRTENDDLKMVYLNDTIKKEEDFPDQLKNFIENNKKDIEIIEKEIKLDYSNFSYEQALRTLIPENISIPFSFERIGHIIHLNLKDEQLPYKNIIGQVILDKNPQAKTVLNKVGEIDTVFRTFKIEILAGEPNLIAEIKENECIFNFNFEEVYWNSRLQYEHMELVNRFTKDDIICDMMAGVGPFALPAAKIKKCLVYANDLNPSSVKYMTENAKRNKLDDKIIISNLDARDFVKSLLYPKNGDKPVKFTQAIMNLPSTSIEFLDVFRDIFLDPINPPPIPPPTINCYTFTRLRKETNDDDNDNDNEEQEEEKEKNNNNNNNKKSKKEKNREIEKKELIEDTIKNVEQVIKYQVPKDCVCYEVRDVAPKKRMMLISFRMPTILPYIENKKRDSTSLDETTIGNNDTNNNNNNNENDSNKKIKNE